MKKMIYSNLGIIAAVMILFAASSATIFAQSKTGTTIGQFLKIEPSARSVAMGNAGTALYGEASSTFYNPAALGRITGTDVQFTYNQWLADISYNYASVASYFDGIGAISLQITSLNSGEIDVTTVEQPVGTGEKYTVNDFAIGLGYAIKLTDRVTVGTQFTYFQETIWHSALVGFSMNLGVQYQLTEGGLTLGASLSNFGGKSSFDGRDLYLNHDLDPKKYGDNDQLPAQLRTESFGLPTTFRAGVAFPIKIDSDNSILLAAEAMHPNDNGESINLGGEFTLMKYFCIRGGYRNLFLAENEGGLVFGGGIKTEILGVYRVRFDYAYAEYGRLNQAHRLTVSVGF